MKKISLWLLAFSTFFLTACAKSDPIPPVEEIDVIAKWEISSPDSDFISFEFSKGDVYIINYYDDDDREQVLSDDYEKIGLNEYSLKNFGTLKIEQSEGDVYNLTIVPAGGVEMIVKGSPAEELIASSTNTDLLTRAWDIYEVDGESTQGTEYEGYVIFSKAGTYFLNRVNIQKNFVNRWQWKDAEEVVFCFSSKPEGQICTGEDSEVNISEMTESHLIIFDGATLAVLHPR